MDLHSILHPVTPSVFLKDHWEREHLVVAREFPSYFNDLFSLEAVDFLVGCVREPEFSLVKDGKAVLPATFCKNVPWKSGLIQGIIDRSLLVDEIRAGATLILEFLQDKWPPIALACRNLERFFALEVQANAYITPPNSQGFAAHYDTHDVFVLQIEGAKRWRIYGSPVEHPTKDEKFSDKHKPLIGSPKSEFVLHSGDTLYIPRGQIHEAAATAAHSLHITVGVMPYTYRRLLHDIVLRLSATDASLRKGVPLAEHHAVEHLQVTSDSVRNECIRLLDVLKGEVERNDQAILVRNQFLSQRASRVPGQLTAVLGGGDITSDTRFQVVPDLILSTKVEQDGIRVSFGGRHLVLPRELAPEVCFLHERRDPFTLGQLPDVRTVQAKIDLLRQLLDAGLVCFA